MANWFYSKGQQQLGPVSLQELRRLASTGELARNDLVWSEGMANWLPAANVPEVFPAGAGAGSGAAGPAAYGNAQQSPAHAQPLGYGHYGYAPASTPPPNYLVQAILVTLFCCMPMGIAAIVFAAQVNSKHAAGDVAGAIEASGKAKFWAWMSFWFGFVPSVLYLILMVVAGVAEAGSL